MLVRRYPGIMAFTLALTVLWASLPHSVGASPSTYFVAPYGDDAGPGTEGQPWRSIQKAAGTLRAGDTVYVRGGEYAAVPGGTVFGHSGTETAPITLTNYPGERVIIRLPGPEPDYAAFRCWGTRDWLT
ncbi:MAG: hypothetical protein IT304_13090, partial [Dehalococcoidia bacterium]|nr:hypothetical protein [Dehalococcoidia bacterium]